jgi:cation-transporting ATPase 13A2
MEDVEMAQDEVYELQPMPPPGPPYRYNTPRSAPGLLTTALTPKIQVFSGPMSESVPTSVSGFHHRRRLRADSSASLTSFAYYDEEQDSEGDLDGDLDEEDEDSAILEDGESAYDGYTVSGLEEEDLEAGVSSQSSQSPASHSPSPSRRKSSGSGSRKSSERPLLRRNSSAGSAGSGIDWRGRRSNQKIYIMTEDLTIVIAGFKTSPFGYTLYALLCIATLGLGWLLLRWLPRWRVAIIGKATPLKECDWIITENQWGEFAVQDVSRQTYGRSMSTVFGDPEKGRAREWDEDDDPLIKELQCLDYRYIRFVYHPIKDKFVLANTWKDPTWTEVSALREGLDNDERDYRELVFGKNLIDIAEKTIGQLLVDEVFHPFYVFQIASLLLWSIDEYYYYACAIFIISAVSIVTTLMETKASMKRLREVSKFECDVRVLRSGFWTHVDSAELVPGDVYEVTDPALTQFPCDSLLLSGDCIVNESMLTGESIPVSKIPVSDQSLDMLDLSASAVHPEIARSMLFSGTKIIRARRPHEDHVDDEAAALAMVVRTGFNTTKGALVRSMLFPKPSGFKFYRDSFRYISVMAIIAMIGFVASFINFVHLGLAWHLIVVRALDLITIVVPPALPATLTIGTSFALSRLKQKQIFCISPQRVNVGGKLDVVCFDKTGTLTEEGLDVLGVRVVERPRNRFSELLPDAYDILPASQHDRDPTVEYLAHKTILYTMATCHSLRKIDNELVGDPLDVKMFDFTGWNYEEGEQKSGNSGDDDPEQKLSPSVARPPPGREYDVDDVEDDANRKQVELGVLKAFEFVSQLRRASVIVRQFGSKSGQVYVKGAPEVMKEICRPGSFPTDYEELLAFYTHRGFRVIACATKSISKLNWLKVQKMKRDEAESELDFVGFIIFENKLKDSSAPVIEELERANIRKVMCTGDNILTAISVARECGLINKTAHCFIPHFEEGDSRTALSKLSWESVDDPVFKLDENTLKPLPPPPEADVSLPYDISNLRNYSLAVSGDVFRWIVDFASESLLREMLVCGQVFARMSPDEKHELVEKLQSIDYCVGFCGDGANDCGALKAADVGISLSEAEASVAAPFTSRQFDISCVPEVIKEGRAALVTSFSCFKYMSLYSAIQFCSVSFLYASASNLGDFQFLFIDLLLILPIAIFMGWSGAYPTLSRKRPTANLVSRKVLTPLLGQMVLCILIQAVAFNFVQRQEWYMPPVIDPNHSNSLNSQNTALFLVSCFQYILSAVVLSVGKPYREPMSRNLPFITSIFVTLAITLYMLFDPAAWVMSWMELTFLDTPFKVFILALGLGNFAMAYISERLLFPGLSKWIGVGKVKFGGKGMQKKRKEYKIIAESMRM